MHKIKKILQHKKMMCVLMIILLVVMLIRVTYCATYEISDVPKEVAEYLEINDFFNLIARPIGGFIHNILSLLLNYVEDGFLKLASFDIFALEPIQKFDTNMKNILSALIPLALVVSIIVRVFKIESPLKTFTNAILTMLMIGVFVTLMGIGFNLKNAIIKDIDVASGKQKNEHISDVLLKSNTVDVKESIKKHKVVRLNEVKDIDLKKVDLNATLDKKFLNTKYSYEDGKLTVEDLSNGTLGLFKEYYYRYKTDYLALNITEICSLVIYLLSIYKLAYMSGEWLKIKFTGVYFMLKGFHNLDNNGKIYGAGIKNLIAITLIYFGMTFFTIVSTALMQTDILDNWLLKAVVILAIGMSLVVGSGFFNEINGIDDGSGFMMKSMFAGGRLGRIGKSMVRSGANALDTIGGGASQIANVGSNIANGINDSLANHDRRRINEDMNDWYQENQTKYLTDDGTILAGFNPTPDEPHQYGVNDVGQNETDQQSYSNDPNGYDEKQLQENLALLRGKNFTRENEENDFRLRNSNNSMDNLRNNLANSGLHLNNNQIANAYKEFRNGKSLEDIKNDYVAMNDNQSMSYNMKTNQNNNDMILKDVGKLNSVTKKKANEYFENNNFDEYANFINETFFNNDDLFEKNGGKNNGNNS